MSKPSIDRFNESVHLKYEVYNSILMTLPFKGVSSTGTLLPLFSKCCELGYEEHKNPTQITDDFFDSYLNTQNENTKIEQFFEFIKYIERQVVLFDAIEEASFPVVNNMDGIGSLRHLKDEVKTKGKNELLSKTLKKANIRVVLTAHPTQFYPGAVLGIITDLAKAIKKDDMVVIKQLLAQLGKTPFFNKEKPTPYDEALSLVWFLENVFYQSIGEIYTYIQKNILKDSNQYSNNKFIELGFWPGGDRDGNPYVTKEITLKVAKKLKQTLVKNYHKDIRVLKRRLTFRGVIEQITKLDTKLYNYLTYQDVSIDIEDIKNTLEDVKKRIIQDHESIFIEKIEDLIFKINLFGLHFACLDIRQDSSIHDQAFDEVLAFLETQHPNFKSKTFKSLDFEKQTDILSQIKSTFDISQFKEKETITTFESILAMQEIQESNGEPAANRYIISNSQAPIHVYQILFFMKLTAWTKPKADIIPLFETIDDLQLAKQTMKTLYENRHYMAHLKHRDMRQTIMLGFSDGTKDGGYLMANWSIYKAKEALTEISREYNVKVIFFDGRGGPPARGGGKTHQFYQSMGNTIESESVQLTIQGQTISSNYGTKNSCKFNLEQLLSASINNTVFSEGHRLSQDDRATFQELADLSYHSYSNFKNHEKFIPYLEKMGTVRFYGKTNIGSRPTKRANSKGLDFASLRAIPFVGSWNQLKQNVPGFFGLGTALKAFKDRGEFDKVKLLYKNALFFRTLIENSMMSLTKSFFKLTSYMKDDPDFGDFWNIIFEEYQTTRSLLLELSEFSSLMENLPVGKASIGVREQIVRPLLTIQQYALRRLNQLEQKHSKDQKLIDKYEKIVTRCMFGNINAGRNSA